MKNSICTFASSIFSMSLIFAGLSNSAMADESPGDVEQGDSWQEAPYDFIFGNHIDTHIQLKLKSKKTSLKSLKGSLYVIYTGAVDDASGLPVARHPRGASHNERCGIDPITCVVGWSLKGRPGAAKFLYHDGVNGDDHPIWMVNRAEESSAPVPDMVIPQPGYYSHYHWITQASNDPRAADVSDDCDQNNAGQLEMTAVNDVCVGWFLQIKAVEEFAFEHGGELIPTYKGADLRSHLNIVTNYTQFPAEPITPTRD